VLCVSPSPSEWLVCPVHQVHLSTQALEDAGKLHSNVAAQAQQTYTASRITDAAPTLSAEILTELPVAQVKKREGSHCHRHTRTTPAGPQPGSRQTRYIVWQLCWTMTQLSPVAQAAATPPHPSVHLSRLAHPDPTISTLLSGRLSRARASSLVMACSPPSMSSFVGAPPVAIRMFLALSSCSLPSGLDTWHAQHTQGSDELWLGQLGEHEPGAWPGLVACLESLTKRGHRLHCARLIRVGVAQATVLTGCNVLSGSIRQTTHGQVRQLFVTQLVGRL